VTPLSPGFSRRFKAILRRRVRPDYLHPLEGRLSQLPLDTVRPKSFVRGGIRSILRYTRNETMNKPGCPFCSKSPSESLCSSNTAFAFLDPYPITEGHTLVVPHRHVQSLYQLSAVDQAEVHALVAEVRSILVLRYGVTDFNIGINDGLAAGQTVPHAHIHVIPRRHGDVPDPKGGVRWVIPDKAKYW